MGSDDELYSLFLAGDIPSYDQLMIVHGNSLTFYLNGYVHDLQDAEDLMIEAFARIMVKKPRIQPGAFKAYLYKTGRNLAIRFMERKRSAVVFSLEELSTELADTLRTEDAVAAKQKREILEMCLQRIEPLLREALWLVYYDDLSYAQAAEIMKVSVKKIDHLLARAKQNMRRELEKEGISSAYE